MWIQWFEHRIRVTSLWKTQADEQNKRKRKRDERDIEEEETHTTQISLRHHMVHIKRFSYSLVPASSYIPAIAVTATHCSSVYIVNTKSFDVIYEHWPWYQTR